MTKDGRGPNGRFLTGNSGGGRKPGARSRLSEAFIQAMFEDFQKHGVRTIELVRETEPAKYLAVIARMVPKEIDLEVSSGPFASWADDELDALLTHIRQQIRDRGDEANGGLH